MHRHHRFTTERLIVDEWHSFSADEWAQQNLVDVVQQVMTESVTKTLPPPWQGKYSQARARQWITERDAEGVTLLALNNTNAQPVGLTVLFDADNNGHLRLGYMLAESAWGKGFATELISGLVNWARSHQVHSITGGVEPHNIASARVLEKCGFSAQSVAQETPQLMYRISFN